MIKKTVTDVQLTWLSRSRRRHSADVLNLNSKGLELMVCLSLAFHGRVIL